MKTQNTDYITRTVITETTITGYDVEIVEGEPHVLKVGPITVNGNIANDSEARAALKRAGYMFSRGLKVDVQKGGKKKYRMPLDLFMQYAEEVPEDEESEDVEQ